MLQKFAHEFSTRMWSVDTESDDHKETTKKLGTKRTAAPILQARSQIRVTTTTKSTPRTLIRKVTEVLEEAQNASGTADAKDQTAEIAESPQYRHEITRATKGKPRKSKKKAKTVIPGDIREKNLVNIEAIQQVGPGSSPTSRARKRNGEWVTKAELSRKEEGANPHVLSGIINVGNKVGNSVTLPGGAPNKKKPRRKKSKTKQMADRATIPETIRQLKDKQPADSPAKHATTPTMTIEKEKKKPKSKRAKGLKVVEGGQRAHNGDRALMKQEPKVLTMNKPSAAAAQQMKAGKATVATTSSVGIP